jgi:hypothetical protein
MPKVRKFVFLTCIAIAVVGIAASFASNPRLCFERMTVLGDDEYFKGAIDIVIHDPVDGITEYYPGGSTAKLIHSQKYSSPDEFLSENPHCCRFVPANSGDGGPEVGFLERIIGIRVVEVSYTKRYFDDGQQKASKVIAQVAVTSCGRGLSYR